MWQLRHVQNVTEKPTCVVIDEQQFSVSLFDFCCVETSLTQMEHVSADSDLKSKILYIACSVVRCVNSRLTLLLIIVNYDLPLLEPLGLWMRLQNLSDCTYGQQAAATVHHKTHTHTEWLSWFLLSTELMAVPGYDTRRRTVKKHTGWANKNFSIHAMGI